MSDERIKLSTGYFLSGIQDGDQSALVQHLADGRIGETIPILPFPYGMSQADWWVQHRVAFRAEHGHETTFAIRRPDGYLVGSVGVDDYRVRKRDTAELGYWLSPVERGRGTATLAVRQFVRYAFDHLRLRTITACTLEGNLASQRLLERIEFEYLETRPSFTKTRKGLYDTLFYRCRAPNPLTTDCS